jgi:hypothetical protein
MPSAASNASRREAERLASLTFFLDHQIGRYIVAHALRKAGAHVEAHLDHFKADAPDIEWIPAVGIHDWVLITKDQNIRRNPLERAAYKAAKLRGFVVTGKDMGGKELAELLVRSLPGMTRRAAGRPGPLLFTISRGGTFSKLL